MSSYLLALDVGGSGGRCLLVNTQTAEQTVTRCAWQSLAVRDSGGWGATLPMPDLWSALAQTTQTALRRARVHPQQIIGIATTAMRFSLVLLDEHGDVLWAVPNRDARAAMTAMAMADAHGKQAYARCGRKPHPIFAATRLAWLSEQSPDLLARTRQVLTLDQWLNYRLTGTLASDPSQAGESLLADLRTVHWSPELAEWAHWQIDKLPAILPATQHLGTLQPAAAQAFGLQAGTPVFLGGADTQCALLGVGAVDAGQTAVVAGSSATLQQVQAQPVVDAQARLWSAIHLLPERWLLESNAGSMGDTLTWLANLLFADHPQPVARLLAEAEKQTTPAVGLLSTLGAEIFNAQSLGLPVGNLTLSHILTPPGTHQQAQVARVVLEGLAFGVRANLEQINQASGYAPNALFLAGGLARSRYWGQLLSDVCGLPIVRADCPDSSALGAALCAGVGAGVFASLASASQSGFVKTHLHHPAPSAYGNLYTDWRALLSARAESDSQAGSVLLQGYQAKEESPTPVPVALRPRLLVTAQLDSHSLTELQTLADVEYAPYRDAFRVLSGDDLVQALAEKDGLVTEVDLLDADVLARLPNLRVVVCCRGAVVNVDVAACTAFGVPVIHTPGRNAHAVADLTLAFFLALARDLPSASRFLHGQAGEAGDLARMGQAHHTFFGRELFGKTVGLVGLGAVGRQVAHRLQGFDCRLLSYDPYLTAEQAALAGVVCVSLDELLESSDFVSLHAPVTPETRQLLNAERLAQMKSSAYLVNTARAALVDEVALADALHSGRLAGAAVDVFANEPPASDDRLLTAPNLIATPHIAGNTREVATHQGQQVLCAVQALLSGQVPAHLLNPTTLAKFSWTGMRLAPAAELVQRLQADSQLGVSDLMAQPAKPSLSPQTPHVVTPTPSTPATPRPAGGWLARLGGFFRASPKLAPSEALTSPNSHPLASANAMQVLVSGFLARASQDGALQAYAETNTATQHYVLSEPDLRFYLSFAGGQVWGALGDPPHAADLTLKMKAEVLDAMLSGALDGMRAAMSGKMKFAGDTRKAMGMQKIQRDLIRLYSAVRAEVGAPNLQAQVAPAVQQTLPAADERQEMLSVLQLLYAQRLVTANGGNVSVRQRGQGDRVWITPSAMPKGELRAEWMVSLDLQGRSLDERLPTPSSERFLHTAIYRARPDVQAVIHSHARWATILAIAEIPFEPLLTEAELIGRVAIVPYLAPGTPELGQAVAEALGADGQVALLKNHGLVVAAPSLQQAAILTESAERVCEVLVRLQQLRSRNVG
jgi:autoinducer 2 (AI-2) kinase